MSTKSDDTITAIVPARKEKDRLEDKNILPFGDSNLLIHKLRQLRQIPQLDHIIVTSEDDEILQLASDFGVTALKRPDIYADRRTPFGEFVEYICNQVPGKHILWACVTSPFVDSDLYENAIEKYKQALNEGYDSLISVQRLKRFIVDANGSVNFRRGLRHKNSEDLPLLYLYTNGIVLAPREKMIEWKYNWGHIPYMLEVDKKTGLDISDEYDYYIARLMEENQH